MRTSRITPKLKFLALAAMLGLFFQSCSSDDDSVDPNADINADRFTNLEIGNAESKIPQMNVDVHTEFDYTGKSKVEKIYFDVEAVDVDTPGDDEMVWKVTDHLVPEENYAGQLNPHIHYHILFDPDNMFFPAARPVKGTYNLKIRIIEEDGTESQITRTFEIVKKFFDLEVGYENEVAHDSDDIHIEFEYLAETTVSDIKFQLYFQEWRSGQDVAVGEWNSITEELPKALYEGKKNPHIHSHMEMVPDTPVGTTYFLLIYVTEVGAKEAVRLGSVVNVVEEIDGDHDHDDDH